MTKRDRSAERRVAEFLSQNAPAPKMEQAPADDLFTAAEKARTEIIVPNPPEEGGGEYVMRQTAPDIWIGKHRTRLPEQFIDVASTAPGSATSARAADAIGDSRRPKAYLLYQHIKSMGKYGATRQEIVDALGISLQTVCSLVRRLYQMGLIGSNPEHTRRNRFSAFENEVMLHEDHVTRWQPDQTRPPMIPKWMGKQ